MGAGDRAENRGEDFKGKVKEGVGKATDNDRLKNEGRGDQAKASVKDAVEDVKDAAGKLFNKDK
ncbi:CsbD family protein [Micrococcoides hystricis]|uniref:CsbD family protein n=1 Tax=Micrococcoides hystricis TaxID=1572761 RepID=A0ABV6PCJ9_9MICC